MRNTICLLSLLLSVAALPAQDLAAKEAALGQQAAAILLPFAHLCESNKLMTQAKSTYELIVDYDAENRPARRALGFQKAGGKWQPPTKVPPWPDKANQAQRDTVAAAWSAVQKQLAALHRDLGLELLPHDQPHGEAQLQRALAYDPGDAEAHRALGHIAKDGFFGTQEQVDFLEHMQALQAAVAALRTQTFAVEALAADQLPPELQKTGLEFKGTKSPHFTIWMRGSQQEADDCAQWAERARAFLIHILGKQRLEELNFERRLTYDFVAFVWSAEERDQFLAANPDTWTGQDASNIRCFDDFFWDRANKGRGAVVWTVPERILDRLVGFVAFQGFLFGHNEGLGEGLLHATTWYLLGTTWTWYGSLPSTKSSGEELLKPDPDVWLVRLREQIAGLEDWPLQQVPREVLTQYRPKVRIKAWYVMVWLLARYPDQWLPFYLELSKHKVLMPEQVEAIGVQCFGRSLGEIEQEWREWAKGTSAIAKASGHGL